MELDQVRRTLLFTCPLLPWTVVLLAPTAGAQEKLLDALHQMLPPDSGDSSAVDLGDVDGDGDLDALIGNNNANGPGNQNRLYLNDGSGVFADATASLPADLNETLAVALGDVDGDGDLDALIGNGRIHGPGEQNRLYLNDGTGVFADATASLPADLEDTRAVALGDVDGDGDLDALIGNSLVFGPGDQNRLYLNDGTGVFARRHRKPPRRLRPHPGRRPGRRGRGWRPRRPDRERRPEPPLPERRYRRLR